jgi:hypothetical protein
MAAVWLLCGWAVGSLAVAAIAWTVGQLRPGQPREAVALVLGGGLLRWVLASGLLLVAWRQGILPGMLALTGYWVGRWGAIYWIDRRNRPPLAGRVRLSGDLTND